MTKKILQFFSRRGQSNRNAQQCYEELFGTLNPDKLGFGCDVHRPDTPTDWSSAYAMIASAELRNLAQLEGGKEKQDSIDNINRCCDWLLNNTGCASTGAQAWSLPYPRQIWEDEEPVKHGTAFCIPTAHSIQVMCEISQNDVFSADLREKANLAALNAATYYTQNCFDELSDGCVFWYSTLPQHSFHVTNASSMMAGQIQRVFNQNPQHDLLSTRADGAIAYLLKLRFETPAGFGWNYFGDRIPSNKKNKSNDILHEAFVCHGLLEYKQFNGTHADMYSYKDLYDSLYRFYRNDHMHEFSDVETNERRKKNRARALGIGHTLYVTSRLESLMAKEPPKIRLSDIIFKDLEKEYIRDGQLLYRPLGIDVTSRTRVVSHVLLGLSEYSSVTL